MYRSLLSLCFIFSALQLCGQPKDCLVKESGRINVVVFLAVDCPISQKYIPALNALYERYRDEHVTVQSFVPGNATKRAVNIFRKEFDIRFPVNRDSDYQCVETLAAKVTPEVFVFDGNGIMRYRGAIDNWFFDLGEYRREITEHYLANAIDALLKKGSPSTVNTEAVGCPIQIPKRTASKKTHDGK